LTWVRANHIVLLFGESYINVVGIVTHRRLLLGLPSFG